MIRLSEIGETESTDGWCPYCQGITAWLITVLPEQWLRFECTKCCKISRDVLLSQTEEVSDV